jgi:hypothetical protein
MNCTGLQSFFSKGKVRGKHEVNFPLEQAMKAQRGSSGILILSFLNLGGIWGWLTPRPGLLPPPGKRPDTHSTF